MWVFGSLVFLVPAIYLTTRLLANGRLVSEKDPHILLKTRRRAEFGV
jgi:hypothetical protein